MHFKELILIRVIQKKTSEMYVAPMTLTILLILLIFADFVGFADFVDFADSAAFAQYHILL